MAEKKRRKISRKRLEEILAGKGIDPISLGIEEDSTGPIEGLLGPIEKLIEPRYPAAEMPKKSKKQGGGPVYRKKGSSKKGEKKKTRKELLEEILADGVRGPFEGAGAMLGLKPFKEGYQDPETIFPSTIMPKKSKKQGGGPVYRKKGSSKKGEKKKPTEPSPKTHPGMNTPAIMISIVSPNRRLGPGAQAKKLISGGRTAAERRTDKLQSAARSKVMKASHGGAVVAARHNRASSGPVSRGAGAAVKGIKFKGVR